MGHDESINWDDDESVDEGAGWLITLDTLFDIEHKLPREVGDRFSIVGYGYMRSEVWEVLEILEADDTLWDIRYTRAGSVPVNGIYTEVGYISLMGLRELAKKGNYIPRDNPWDTDDNWGWE